MLLVKVVIWCGFILYNQIIVLFDWTDWTTTLNKKIKIFNIKPINVFVSELYYKVIFSGFRIKPFLCTK